MSKIIITINSFKCEMDSEDPRIKEILEKIESDDNLSTLMRRQVIAAEKIAAAKAEVVFWQMVQNVASDAYSKFSQPHFTENTIREHCKECGRMTSWLWNYEPHCKNNNQPNCFNIATDSIPLDSTMLNLLEDFADESEAK